MDLPARRRHRQRGPRIAFLDGWRHRADYRADVQGVDGQCAVRMGIHGRNQVGRLRGAALPMAFNRKPHYADGLLLVGDAGGMVSPFNEDRLRAPGGPARGRRRGLRAHSRPTITAKDRALAAYPAAMRESGDTTRLTASSLAH